MAHVANWFLIHLLVDFDRMPNQVPSCYDIKNCISEGDMEGGNFRANNAADQFLRVAIVLTVHASPDSRRSSYRGAR